MISLEGGLSAHFLIQWVARRAFGRGAPLWRVSHWPSETLRTSTSTATVLLLCHQSFLMILLPPLFLYISYQKGVDDLMPIRKSILVMGKMQWIIIHRHRIDDFLLVVRQTDRKLSTHDNEITGMCYSPWPSIPEKYQNTNSINLLVFVIREKEVVC